MIKRYYYGSTVVESESDLDPAIFTPIEEKNEDKSAEEEKPKRTRRKATK